MSDAKPVMDATCMDDFDPRSIAPDEALRRIRSAIEPVTDTERRAIRECIDRVLAEDIQSHADVPPAGNSAMDGYAIRGADIPETGARELRVIGTALAGRPLFAVLQPGTAVRIMTGAILPEGADTVVMQESVERTAEVIRIRPDIRPGDHVRMAGEDIHAGETVLETGHRLTPADIGLLASLGIGQIQVWRRPRVAYFSTGDELRSIGEPLAAGEIYDSNRYTLFGMLGRLGVDTLDLGVVRDRRDAVEAAVDSAAAYGDVVISSGGVSVGEADYVKETLEKVGKVEFWKVAMKPGRPLAFGRVGKAWFFGLPGNPVSVMVTFYQFVQPALRHLMGERGAPLPGVRVRCASRLKKRPGRVEYQRGVLAQDEAGELVVRKTGAQGSGILRSMSQANCFIVLPLESAGVEPGAMVEVQPFYGLV
ncbi:MAG: molybdopterin molybdotransferase MoeA [Gammaproteobacteria bacterium]|nr:molybdopterin molybdotransferase MoeA [Gammaproteobacteria bacterium]